MKIALELTEELSAALKDIGKQNLLSVEDVAKMALSDYVPCKRGQPRSLTIPRLFICVGEAILRVAAHLEEEAMKKNEPA